MIVEIQYKTTFIKIVTENELSVKVENLKKSLRSSLITELDKLEKNNSLNHEQYINSEIQNKNISNNSTIKHTLNMQKIHVKTEYIEEIRELLLDEDKFSWRLFEINSKTQVPVEKKDENYIKIRESTKHGKDEIKLLLSRSYKNKQSLKTNLFNKINKSSTSSTEDTSELIRIMTGAKEKVKVEDKDKKKKLSNLFNDDPDHILQTLMGLNSNNGDARVAFIQDLLGVRHNQSQSSSTSNNTGTNPRTNLQNRIFQSILNIGGNRPPIVSTTEIPRVTPNQAKLQQLLEMGFAEDRARRALIMTRNNLEAAVEVIANEQDLSYEEPNESQNSNNNQHSEDLNEEQDDEIHIDEVDDEDV